MLRIHIWSNTKSSMKEGKTCYVLERTLLVKDIMEEEQREYTVFIYENTVHLNMEFNELLCAFSIHIWSIFYLDKVKMFKRIYIIQQFLEYFRLCRCVRSLSYSPWMNSFVKSWRTPRHHLILSGPSFHIMNKFCKFWTETTSKKL